MATQYQIDYAATAANSASIAYNSAVFQAQFMQSVANRAAAGVSENRSAFWVGSIEGKEFTDYTAYVAYAQKLASNTAAAARDALDALTAANENWKALLAEGTAPVPATETAVPAPEAVNAPPPGSSTPLPPAAAAKVDAARSGADTVVDEYDKNREQIRRSTGNPNATNATDAVTQKSDTKLTPAPSGIHTPLPNPLHEYATYTYGLTLFMLTTSEFEEMQTLNESSLAAWVPKHALISSAGRYNKLQQGNSPGRQAQFTDDFYFDNFKMTTIIGVNSQTRGTNAIGFSFTVIEPYGLTLLDRLIEAANGAAVNSQNYLMQPYLLELDFFGATDLGEISNTISGLKKRFPIKLQEFKIKAGVKGAEYSIKGYPFSHSSLQEIAVATPVHLEVTASSIGNFFKATTNHSIKSDLTAQKNKRKDFEAKQQQLADSKKNGADQRTLDQQSSALTATNYDANTPYNVISYTDAINDWNDMLTESDADGVGKMADCADSIEFQFSGFDQVAPDILNNSVIVTELPNDTKAMYGVKVNANAQAQTSNGQIVNSANMRVFNINAGTSIIDVVNMVMRSSDYIRRQIVDVSGKPAFKDGVPVDFYKIIPQVVKLDYDDVRKRYATKTIYHIVYYTYFNSKSPNLPYVTPTSAVKTYNYIYTGKNIDILEFSIDFDVAYYTAVVALPGNVNSGNNRANNTEGNKSLDPNRTNTGKGSIGPQQLHMVSNDANSGASGVQTGEEHLVASALSSIYSNARGDMINVKLKIVGDPHFIKQDDVYTAPTQQQTRGSLVSTNGTIMTDYSDIFCRISFRTPTDMDDVTGLMRSAGEATKFAESKFTGFYRITKVDSEFARGVFTQTLDCIRMQDLPPVDSINQRKDTASATPASSDVRAVETPLGAKAIPALSKGPDNVIVNDANSIRKFEDLAANPVLPGVRSINNIDRAAEQSALDLARSDSITLRRAITT